jgi:hypothetical protein
MAQGQWEGHYATKMWCTTGGHWVQRTQARYDPQFRPYCFEHKKLLRMVTRNVRERHYLNPGRWQVPQKTEKF